MVRTDWIRTVCGKVEVLNTAVTNADIGILKFSDLFNFEIQQRNAEFFEKVGFVFIVEPSKLLATGQIGLNTAGWKIS